MTQPSRFVPLVTLVALLILGIFPPAPLAAGTDVTIEYGFLPPGPNYTQAETKALLRMGLIGAGTFPRTDVDWKGPQGQAVSCHPTGGGCTIRNEYSANGSLIGATHEFWIAGQGRAPGTYTAIGKYCYPDPYIHVCTGWTEFFRLNFYISSAGAVYMITGKAGVAGASLAYFDGGAKTATADGAGNYAITVPAGWSGTVTPSRAGYFFLPPSRTYAAVQANAAGQDFSSVAVASRIYLPEVLSATSPTTLTVTSGAPVALPALPRLR
jgi:hypothetical protein